MAGAVLQCTRDLVDGVCPEGATAWLQQRDVYDLLWQLPSGTEFHDVLQAGVTYLLAPAVALIFAAYATRKATDQV